MSASPIGYLHSFSLPPFGYVPITPPCPVVHNVLTPDELPRLSSRPIAPVHGLGVGTEYYDAASVPSSAPPVRDHMQHEHVATSYGGLPHSGPQSAAFATSCFQSDVAALHTPPIAPPPVDDYPNTPDAFLYHQQAPHHMLTPLQPVFSTSSQLTHSTSNSKLMRSDRPHHAAARPNAPPVHTFMRDCAVLSHTESHFEAPIHQHTQSFVSPSPPDPIATSRFSGSCPPHHPAPPPDGAAEDACMPNCGLHRNALQLATHGDEVADPFVTTCKPGYTPAEHHEGIPCSTPEVSALNTLFGPDITCDSQWSSYGDLQSQVHTSNRLHNTKLRFRIHTKSNKPSPGILYCCGESNSSTKRCTFAVPFRVDHVTHCVSVRERGTLPSRKQTDQVTPIQGVSVNLCVQHDCLDQTAISIPDGTVLVQHIHQILPDEEAYLNAMANMEFKVSIQVLKCFLDSKRHTGVPRIFCRQLLRNIMCTKQTQLNEGMGSDMTQLMHHGDTVKADGGFWHYKVRLFVHVGYSCLHTFFPYSVYMCLS